MRARLAEIEQQLRETRQALDQARDRRGELSAAAAKLKSDTEYMEQTAVNELGIAAEAMRSDPAIPRVEGEQLAAEEAMYREMRTRLENMGPVNMMALEEYQEMAQRHTFLETQRKDLLDSIENTQNTIREIDVYLAAEVPGGVWQDQREFPGDVPQAVRRRQRLHAPDRRREHGGERHRRGGLASGQKAAERAACSPAARRR